MHKSVAPQAQTVGHVVGILELTDPFVQLVAERSL